MHRSRPTAHQTLPHPLDSFSGAILPQDLVIVSERTLGFIYRTEKAGFRTIV